VQPRRQKQQNPKKPTHVTIKILLVAMFLTIGVVHAQDFEGEPSDDPALVTTTGNAYVREFPNPDPRVRTITLRPGVVVEVLGINDNGWIRIGVGTVKGWMDRNYLRPLLDPRTFMRRQRTPALTDAHDSNCPPHSLLECPRWGCPNDQKSPAGRMNIRKHGPPTGTLRQIRLPVDFLALQSRAYQAFGKAAKLDAQDRSKLEDIGEGWYVATVGYLVGTAHPNKGESVNCDLTDAAENDVHLTIAASPGANPHQGIVAEMIPQDRNPKWTTGRLNALQGREVLVVGQLFYDNMHRVNANPARNLPGQPPRCSLWEIHPITAFYVCKQDTCNPNDMTQWMALEDLPE
jgi:hypothetical protein